MTDAQRNEALGKARAFRQWAGAYRELEELEQRSVDPEALALAKARREAMALLMESDPDAALREALSYAEYAALPADIQALVERPFSTTALLDVQIACGEHESEYHHFLNPREGSQLELTMPNKHRTGLSKRNLPVQGIELGDQGVVRSQTFQILEGPDIDYVRTTWPSGQVDPGLDFASGLPIEGQGVTAISGGLVFEFQDHESVDHLNELMAQADARIGINIGSSWLMLAASGGDLEQFPEEQFVAETIQADYGSTTGAKTTLVILIDFDDATGQPYTPSSFEQVIDVDVSNALARYSFNQTTMDATVTTTTYRMPNSASYYVGSTGTSDDDKSSELHTDAVAAYVADSNPDPYSEYDTVCVAMTEVGFRWAGLASVGGQNMWLDTSNSGVILHEFGHNYGLYHANYWVFDNTNGSSTNPVDPTGASEEYGDIFDNMGDGNLTDGHFNPGPKAILGWIPSSDWEDLTGSGDNGTYRVYRFDHEDSTGSRGLRIVKSATSDHYWIGYRQDYSNIDNFANGATLTWEKGNGKPAHNQCWLVDTTPGSADGKSDAPITLGRTYTDSASSVHITPVAVGGTSPNQYIDVTVNFGSFPGNNSPTGTLIADTSVNARETILFSVEASDSDGDTLAYDWDMGDGVVKSNSPTIAHSWIQGGSYDIECTVSDMKGGTVVLQATITVTDPLNTWTSRTSGATNNLYGITSNSSHCIIVGKSRIIRSTDGSNWSNVTPSGMTNVYLYDVCWTGNKFVAVGEDYDFGISNWEGVIYTSSDGSSWSRDYEFNAANTVLKGVVGNGAGACIAVGDAATVIRRPSGGSWATVNTGASTSENLSSIAYGDGTYAFVGDGGSVWTSSDGLSWTDRTAGTGLQNWQDFGYIYHTGDSFIASGFFSRICYSVDNAQTWSTNRTGDDLEMFGFTQGAGLVYGVGMNLTAEGGTVYYSNNNTDVDIVSSDGQNWTLIDPGALDDRNDIGFFADTFITVGENGTIRQSGVISSSDSYADFAATHFPGGGSDSLSTANPDGDWASNLVEYALGTNPDSASSVPSLPTFSFDGSNNPVIESTRLSKQTGVAYSAWWSTDLTNWTRQGLTVETDNNTLLRVVADGVDTSGGKGFLRLQFDTP